MGSEWSTKRLGDVITLKRGYDLPTRLREPGNVPIVSSSGISGTHSEVKVAGPGVITGRYGTIGKVFYIEESFWPLNTTLYVQDFKGNHRRFIKYLLETIDFEQFSDKAAVPGVNRNHLHEALVSLPAVGIQEQIADSIAVLEDRIQNLRRVNVTLEAIAQTLFKSWFVDFDPVRAKAEGREPEGMDGETAALFPAEFADAEVGLIPKGWRAGQLSDVLELKYGKSLRAADRKDGEVPVYGSGGVTGFHDKPLIEGPAVIVGRKGTVGSIYWEPLPCFPIDTVFYVEPKQSLHFAYFALRQAGLDGLNTDAAVPGLNRNNAYRQPVVIPPPEVLWAWGNLAAALRARMDTSQAHVVTLRQLRDTLLPRLISGKLRLPDAEREIEAATV